ncbi:transposase [Cronobacter dublinensis subsp. beijingensis]|uniref:transposase n=1 Tax=Cronobacter dublinensis TaxID=413497 RepID=UPI0023DA7F3D|nr:transposase [Cronobacter dublinensis]WEP48215.1 transposase [Cronobacter dublinensis]
MKKRNFSAEFKRESAQLVLDQNYTVAAAASTMALLAQEVSRLWQPREASKWDAGLPEGS